MLRKNNKARKEDERDECERECECVCVSRVVV